MYLEQIYVIISKDTHIIAAFICRGKSILTQTEMFVVFMLDEIISQGCQIGKTAGKFPKSFLIWK